MLVALAEAHRGQRIDRYILWQPRHRSAQKYAVDQRVSGQRKMRPVLLNGRRGQHQHCRVSSKGVYLLPGEISEVTVIRNPALHDRGAPTECRSKVTILPGFSRPLPSYLYFANSCTLSLRYRPPPSTLFTCGLATLTPISRQ